MIEYSGKGAFAIGFSVIGEGALREKFRRAGAAVEDEVKNAGKEGGQFFLERIQKRFLNKVGPDGVPWQPSARGMMREAMGMPWPAGTLYDTGDLFKSIRVTSTGKGTARIASVGVKYAKAHDQGIGQVRRPFLAVPNSDVGVFASKLARRLNSRFRALGIYGG